VSVLRILQTIKKRRLLPSHPLAAAGEDVRRACVSLWIWTAETDGAMNDTERAWLAERFRSLCFDDFSVEDFSAGAPDEQIILGAMALLTATPKNPERWLLLCECWLLAACDGEIQTEERDFLDLAASFLGISEGEAAWLKDTAMAISSGVKAEFRASATQRMHKQYQPGTVFWQVLLSYVDRPEDLIISLTDMYMAQGLEYEKMSLDSEALSRYDAALSIDPACALAHLLKGAVHCRLSHWQTAVEEYDKAAELSPLNYQVYYQRGQAHQTLGDNEKALEDFNQAITLNSEFAALYHHRGQVYAERKAYKLAADDYDQAIEKEPGNDEFYHSLAYAYYHSGQIHQAIVKISRAIEINPSNPNWYDSRAEFHMENGNVEAALADCSLAMSLDECFARAYYFRGVILDKGGKPQAAADDYRKYLELADSNGCEVKEVRERLKELQEI
jgi:tetratricopeptide (TPR) repeat protein